MMFAEFARQLTWVWNMRLNARGSVREPGSPVAGQGIFGRDNWEGAKDSHQKENMDQAKARISQ